MIIIVLYQPSHPSRPTLPAHRILHLHPASLSIPQHSLSAGLAAATNVPRALELKTDNCMSSKKIIRLKTPTKLKEYLKTPESTFAHTRFNVLDSLTEIQQQESADGIHLALINEVNKLYKEVEALKKKAAEEERINDDLCREKKRLRVQIQLLERECASQREMYELERHNHQRLREFYEQREKEWQQIVLQHRQMLEEYDHKHNTSLSDVKPEQLLLAIHSNPKIEAQQLSHFESQKQLPNKIEAKEVKKVKRLSLQNKLSREKQAQEPNQPPLHIGKAIRQEELAEILQLLEPEQGANPQESLGRLALRQGHEGNVLLPQATGQGHRPAQGKRGYGEAQARQDFHQGKTHQDSQEAGLPGEVREGDAGLLRLHRAAGAGQGKDAERRPGVRVPYRQAAGVREAGAELQLSDREDGGERGVVERNGGVAGEQREPGAAAELYDKAAAGRVRHLAGHPLQHFLAAEPQLADPREAGALGE